MWHVPGDGCRLVVDMLPDEIVRIRCNNGNDVTEYHCTVGVSGLLMMFLREHRDGAVSYYDGVKAVSILKTDMVWGLLPDSLKNRINRRAATLTR